MFTQTKVTATFPTISLPAQEGALPVEVSLIAQLGHGAGSHLYYAVSARQQAHPHFVNALDEPSSKLAGTDFSKGDATSLYSFAVGAKGHPFHRHAGHRIFTAIAGSAGAQLRFSTATMAQIIQDPQQFFEYLHCINIPPDSLFTVRFGGETWHQFASIQENSIHPVFFALSCHTNELGGDLSPMLREQVMQNQANIPSLTELLPKEVLDLFLIMPLSQRNIPIVSLSLDAPSGSWQSKVCKTVRAGSGRLRGVWAQLVHPKGFLSKMIPNQVKPLASLPVDSLLASQLTDAYQHQDMFVLQLPVTVTQSAADWLALLLDGFIKNPPQGVGYLMRLRNVLVKPIGLRTATLGCPVSSLLSAQSTELFLQKYPVFAQSIDSTQAQVILGANDKHLLFRSCAAVKILPNNQIQFSLGTRVQYKNRFGHFYMLAISAVHRHYVTPIMLRLAVEYATR